MPDSRKAGDYMPIHLQSLTANSNDSDLLAALLQGALDHTDAAVVSEDQSYIQMAQFLMDVLSKQRIGKLVYTMFRNANEKSLIVLDLDITLDSESVTELRFLDKLPASSDANEYYDVEATDEGQRLQVETVNRYLIRQDIENTTQAVRTSAFPFRLTAYKDLNELNRELGFPGQSVDEMEVVGLHEHFAAPGSFSQDEAFKGETFSVIVGTVKSVRDVEVRFGKYKIPFVIAQIDSALGLLPTAMGRDVFDLDGLVPGAAVIMYADIKADFAVEQ